MTKRELTFDYIGGYGTIQCHDCHHIENVTGALHIHGTDKAVQGFQCQECGKFKVLSFPPDPKKKKCTCGGELTREEVVFCPVCRSQKVTYSMRFIT